MLTLIRSPENKAMALVLPFICIALPAHADWKPLSAGDGLPTGTVIAGTEKTGPNNGQTLRVCRAMHSDQNWHPGKLLLGACQYGYGGSEHAVGSYEVLTASGTWKSKSNGTKNAVLGGEEPGNLMYVCRVSATIDRINRGQHSGKTVGNTCHIGYGGDEWEFKTYELFYLNTGSVPIPNHDLKGSISTLIDFDIGDNPPRSGCGVGRFLLNSTQGLQGSGMLYSKVGPSGRNIYYCRYSNYFKDLDPGSYRVTFYSEGASSPTACNSGYVNAGQTTNISLVPYRCY